MTWWDDFSNNLATDLAPFVTLFGENPTKQYLSECLTVVDAIIFAIAPLGVITAMVSAIRVCGPPSLRAFIGRAQEGAATAEAELCSSTSREVCELYNNGGIARVLGRSKILEFVHDRFDCRPQTGLVYRASRPTEDGWGTGIYTFKNYALCDANSEWVEEKKRENHVSLEQQRHRFAPNPNLTINIGIRAYSPWVSVGVTVIGTALQLGVLAWAAIARYQLHWTRGDAQERYAVPTLVSGTGLLAIGMAMCVSLIDGSTKERVFHRSTTEHAQSRIYWVQPGTQFVGDQAFDSFAYSHPNNNLTRYTTSWKNNRQPPRTLGVCVCVALTAVGFVLQFLGLRACHSSVAVAQLGLTLLMSTARSFLRSNRIAERNVLLADNPEYYAGHELDWLALRIGHLDRPILRRNWQMARGLDCNSLSPTAAERRWVRPENVRLSWCNDTTPLVSGFATGDRRTNDTSALWGPAQRWRYNQYFPPENEGDNSTRLMSDNAAVFLYRARLAYLTQDWGPQLVKSRATARSLSLAIDATMNLLYDSDAILAAGWESVSLMFWAFPCEVTESVAMKHHVGGARPEPKTSGNGGPGYVRLALSRVRRGNNQFGRWEADTSELEAILGLVAWSRVGGPSYETFVDRIFDIRRRGLEDDEETLARAWGGPSSYISYPLASLRAHRPYELFGVHHIPASAAVRDMVAFVHIRSLRVNADNIYLVLAQEVYSVFFSLLLNIVQDIGGETTRVGKKIVNSNVERIQQVFAESGLGTSQDALECIFPALLSQAKVPRSPC
ncbi:uncharacterized protein DSM5745_11210 [Aspergillus mulundensis]|uniref:Uncharacterized protein n=1 Tax=Aspergillus mulundensis TaxID=1810919 RepID=A0A3D8QC23_9EURO|nr:hypothetical protein DSM5745_11210 [Aspergillus mulundensis]RDW59004.1 hypothetical protein DSM5745_11210 [Aspergillus mulundensis]